MTFYFLKIIFNKNEFMKRIFTICTLVVLFFSCKNSGNENKPLTATDFLKLYSTLSLPAKCFRFGFGKFWRYYNNKYCNFHSSLFLILLCKMFCLETVSNYIIHPAGIIHFKTTDYLVTKFISVKQLNLLFLCLMINITIKILYYY